MQPPRIALLTLVAALLSSGGSALAATAHPCSADAVAHAKTLVRQHLGDAAGLVVADGSETEVRAPVRSLRGKGRFDVLEVTTDVAKASYRMRFMYAQGGETCTLMGQEILEVGDPYAGGPVPTTGRTCWSTSFRAQLSRPRPLGTPCQAQNDEDDKYKGVVTP